MRKESLIGHIIEVYSDFAANSAIPADAVLRKFFYNRKYLGAGDRRHIATAYFRTIKNYLRLEAIAEEALPSEEIKPELVVAASFLLFDHTSAKDMQGYLSSLSNSFKQNYPLEVFEIMADTAREEQRLSFLPRSERLSIYFSFPLWFVKEIEHEYSDNAEKVLDSLNGEAPTVLRVNTTTTSRDELRKELAEGGIESDISKISEFGLILHKRINVWDLPSFKRGAFEIQDEASQLVAPFADIHSKRIKILDACAGAGGKTLHLSALLENRGEIFSTDVDPRKLEELRKRVVRSKVQNVRIVHPDKKEKILGDKSGWFDIVLLDVPCSGTGTLRRNPSIKWNLTEAMIAELLEKQRSILEKNIHFVKPGGKLLYATCSILQSEGEEQIDWFCRTNPQFHLEEAKRINPEKDGCDGFFVARLKKEGQLR